MSPLAKLEPKRTEVNRSELRQAQRSVLRKAAGQRIVVVSGRDEGDEKYIVDKRYFEELLQDLRSALETLEITTDTRLFANLLQAAKTIDEDTRLGKLHDFEDAFKV